MDDDHAINLTRDVLKRRVADPGQSDLDTAPNTKKSKPAPTTKIDIGKREAPSKTTKPLANKSDKSDVEMEEVVRKSKKRTVKGRKKTRLF